MAIEGGKKLKVFKDMKRQITKEETQMVKNTLAHEAPLSMGFPWQEYCSGLPFRYSGELLDPEIEPAPPALAGRLSTTEPSARPIYPHSQVLKIIYS